MAAPIVVNVPLVLNDDMPCELDAQARPVGCTPFLGWVPLPAVGGALPQVALPTRQMLRAFSQRCRIGPLPADGLVARNSSIFQTGFVGAGWSRLLTEMDISGLFQVPFIGLRELDAALSALVFQNPQNLALGAADWIQMLPPFAPLIPVVPAAPAGRGRGRGRGAAIGVPMPVGPPPVGPADLRFLALANVERIINSSSNRSFRNVARLAGYLGACFTQNVRADDLSDVRTAAAILRPNLAKFAGLDSSVGPAGDPALAARLGDFLDGAYNALSPFFATPIASDVELQSEGFAAFRYFLGTNSDKAAVEAQRLNYIGGKCASNPLNCPPPQGVSLGGERRVRRWRGMLCSQSVSATTQKGARAQIARFARSDCLRDNTGTAEWSERQ